MMKSGGRVILLFTGVLLMFSASGEATIQSISVNAVDSDFTPGGGDYGLGVFSLEDLVDIVVEDNLGAQMTYDDGHFEMSTSLQSDNSAGVIASGLFDGGTLSYLDNSLALLLSGDIDYVELIEPFDGGGILAGTGMFMVTGGSLASEFVLSFGEIVQITFQINPASIDDFSQGFTGLSNITVTPIPEPATLVLMAAALLGIRRRR